MTKDKVHSGGPGERYHRSAGEAGARRPYTRRPPRTEFPLSMEVTSLLPWFRGQLLEWFSLRGRLFPWREPGRTAYEILVAEILLQRTTAAKVAQVYSHFRARYPSWNVLAAATPAELQAMLAPLGLWGRKARVFLALAQAVVPSGDELPASRAELELLPGIGQYIASAALLTLFAQAEPLIAVNMARVLERFFGPVYGSEK